MIIKLCSGRRSRSPRDRRDRHHRSAGTKQKAEETEAHMRASAKEMGLDPDDYIKRLRLQQQLRETKLKEKELRREQLVSATSYHNLNLTMCTCMKQKWNL